jgi:predicted nucleic acid-binding protein
MRKLGETANIVYDAGVLVAADRNDRRIWAEHKARLEFGLIPLVPSTILAQVSRSPRQVQLRRLLSGCVVVPIGEGEAHLAGQLLGKSQTNDVVDALLVAVARQQKAIILTGDIRDITQLARASGRAVGIVAI